jgi:hypothetical protein
LFRDLDLFFNSFDFHEESFYPGEGIMRDLPCLGTFVPLETFLAQTQLGFYYQPNKNDY